VGDEKTHHLRLGRRFAAFACEKELKYPSSSALAFCEMPLVEDTHPLLLTLEERDVRDEQGVMARCWEANGWDCGCSVGVRMK